MTSLVHGQQFVGHLRWPLTIHAIAFLALISGLWFGLLPAFESRFAGTDSGHAAAWTITVGLVLGPPLLELLTGRAQRPLMAITERAMLGLDAAIDSDQSPGLRLRDRLIVLAAGIATLPLAMALSQVPWIGLPAILVLGAAMAAVAWLQPPMARSGPDLRQRLGLLWHNRWRALGTGLGLQLAMVVPFVNLLLVSSIAAVAGTGTFLRFEKQRPA